MFFEPKVHNTPNCHVFLARFLGQDSQKKHLGHHLWYKSFGTSHVCIPLALRPPCSCGSLCAKGALVGKLRSTRRRLKQPETSLRSHAMMHRNSGSSLQSLATATGNTVNTKSSRNACRVNLSQEIIVKHQSMLKHTLPCTLPETHLISPHILCPIKTDAPGSPTVHSTVGALPACDAEMLMH